MQANAPSNSFGKRLRHLREAKGWSLTELAQRAGISRSYLAQLEADESTPTQPKILQLANALDALASELIGETVNLENVPDSLKAFAESAHLGSADIQMLSRIEYRGKRPSTPEEWKAIYAVIKGMLGSEP